MEGDMVRGGQPESDARGSQAVTPGAIVRCRNRDWVLLPSDESAVLRLRPLTGATDETVSIHRGLTDLISYTLAEEQLRSATFPRPSPDDVADAASASLLWQAARLMLREGATPFRSLGRISIRPRIYQFVPLLMALRHDLVRLLIADDVGVGKTIEALLVARELLDRGEIRRFCVLCPPYLCEQWQKELSEKFNLDAVVIRSGTINQLDRDPRKPRDVSLYEFYPVQVASIDFLKSDRNKHQFLLHCPELVIIDEAHGSAAADGSESQHQRHALAREVAGLEGRHLILLTATPHSGIESAFRSLLGLLRSEFGSWDPGELSEDHRIQLARHFVQRTRRDIEHDWEGEHCFPRRDPADETYPLSREYKDLFSRTYSFCSEMVQAGQSLDKRRQRVRYWGALALLRCVMSSPAAAAAALSTRLEGLAVEDDLDLRPFVFESSEDVTDDEQPTPPVEAAEATLEDSDRRRLRDLGRQAAALLHQPADTKLVRCGELVDKLLREGFRPIIWCRYIATAEYVAEGLEAALRSKHSGIRVVAITGRIGDEERRAKVEELAQEPVRVLVATDCLSEGINLQHAFNAALHYDLPWNPNRLEQREGRVDRYGQSAKVVKTIRYFSPDSAVDGVVLEVLLNKAREIHKTLGTHVPVPAESESVTEAVLNALFLRGDRTDKHQMQFEFGGEDSPVTKFHRRWERDAEREKINRTRFAQRALKPAEVRQELEATDAVLGDPAAVREFVLSAAQRIGLSITTTKLRDVFRVALSEGATATLPAAVSYALPAKKDGQWLISFTSPTPEGAEYLGRNHRFVAALARFLFEEALTKGRAAKASRCGVIRTRAVKRLTTILLLRVRYLVEQPGQPAPLLSEEVIIRGYTDGNATNTVWLDGDEPRRLLVEAQPDANVPMPEKRQLVAAALDQWPRLEPALRDQIAARAAELEKSHKRVRQAVSLRVRELSVKPQLPPDLLGILVLHPVV